jgi:hypothetical protein
LPKRTIEEVIENVKAFKSDFGCNTFQAMAASLDEPEWDDLLILIERLQQFYMEHQDAKPR